MYDSALIKLKVLRERTFFSKGKFEDLTVQVQALQSKGLIDAVVVNSLLVTPRQQYNLERAWKLPVYNRFAVILGIFEKRATTKEAKLQV